MEENELFDDYIQGRLPDAECRAFELRLQQDGALRERFEFYRTVQADMEHWHASAGGREQLLQTLRSQRDASGTTGKVRSLRKYLLPLSAAAALVVTLMLWKFLGAGGGPNADELYAQFTAAESLSSVQRGGAGNGQLEKAADYMTAKKFAEAAAELKAFEGRLNEPHLYLAFCQLQAGMYPQAGSNLDAIIASGNNYAYKARWFKALLLYKSGQQAACKKELELIAGSAAYGDYSKQARQWLQALR